MLSSNNTTARQLHYFSAQPVINPGIFMNVVGGLLSLTAMDCSE